MRELHTTASLAPKMLLPIFAQPTTRSAPDGSQETELKLSGSSDCLFQASNNVGTCLALPAFIAPTALAPSQQ